MVITNSLCECREPGYCRRYRREMRGRFREICAGVNVDLGTAAAFREQWDREAGARTPADVPKSLLLITDQAPGDTVVMTAAVYSLHQAYPGRYLTAIKSPHPEVWEHNPDVDLNPAPIPAELRMHYPAVHQSNKRGIHFMQGFCEFLGMALGIHVPLLTNRPHLYFADPAPPVEDYWLICSGGKRDFTNKLWGQDNYQEVVDRLQGKVQFVQVGAAGDDHPPLSGVYSVVGKTSLRGLFDLVRKSRGVVCGVSLLMHVVAALEKPAIIIAGGREPVQWNAYPRQHFLHRVGVLPCTTSQGDAGGACWRSRVIPLGDGSPLDKDTCLRPVDGIPECMRMVTPEEVVGLVLRYDR